MRLSSYWIANFIFDAIKLYITIATTIILFLAFDLDYPTAIVIFLLFPFGIMPFTYVFSFCFTADSAAQTFTMFFHMVNILALSSTVFIIRIVPDLEVLGDRLHWAFRAVPSYSIASSLYIDASVEFLSQVRNSTFGEGIDISPDPWHWNNNLMDVFVQIAHFLLWSFILFLIEADLGKRLRKCVNCCARLRYPSKNDDLKIDPDVIAEANRVSELHPEDLKIKVENLRKVYSTGGCCCCVKPLVAVESLSFGLEAGQCFALLGVNGAGKSTTFKTLTGEIEPTSGSIHIGALSIRKDFNKIKKLIGYCP